MRQLICAVRLINKKRCGEISLSGVGKNGNHGFALAELLGKLYRRRHVCAAGNSGRGAYIHNRFSILFAVDSAACQPFGA